MIRSTTQTYTFLGRLKKFYQVDVKESTHTLPLENTSLSQTSSKAPNPPLAYHDARFMDGDEGRPLRILAEYLEPLNRFRQEKIHDTVVFFGSARLKKDGPMGRYYAEAREVSRRLTEWSMTLPGDARFVVCSGGGGSIMEAANLGAKDAGGRSIGLNIGLPHEQRPNSSITPELLFEFHYFFMRKLWFSQLARALIVFPGGFGTIDEMMEMLTLSQTGKLDRKIHIVLYGTAYWKEIINFDALVRHGTISAQDLKLFHFADDPDSAVRLLKEGLPIEVSSQTPAIAKCVTTERGDNI